jgi:hypothetical protein
MTTETTDSQEPENDAPAAADDTITATDPDAVAVTDATSEAVAAENVASNEESQTDDKSSPDEADDKADGSEDAEVIAAMAKLSERLFERMCRSIPVKTLTAELQKVDRAVYFRYFKGHRPNKIDAKRLSKVLRKELFERQNGLLAQLVVYNWDEHQWRLFGALQRHIKAINEDVEAIKEITAAEADPIFDDLEQSKDARGRQQFDRRDVAIACIINGVRVDDSYVQARWGDLLK